MAATPAGPCATYAGDDTWTAAPFADGVVLIGDAAYQPRLYLEPDTDLPEGQASDVAAWRDSLSRLRSAAPDRVHFCHSTEVLHS